MFTLVFSSLYRTNSPRHIREANTTFVFFQPAQSFSTRLEFARCLEFGKVDNPFKIIEQTPEEKKISALTDVMEGLDPSFKGLANVMRGEQAARRDALRSRVAAAFKFIYFGGEDRRVQTSFWHE